MGVITGLGWLFSGVLKFFPGAPTIVVYALAAAAVIGLPAGYAYHRGVEGRAAAVAAEVNRCEARIAGAKRAAELTIQDILDTVKDEPLPTDLADACRKSSMCRENR